MKVSVYEGMSKADTLDSMSNPIASATCGDSTQSAAATLATPVDAEAACAVLCARNGKNKGTDALGSCNSYSLEYTDNSVDLSCILSSSLFNSDKGILTTGCKGDSTMDNAWCVREITAEYALATTTAT